MSKRTILTRSLAGIAVAGVSSLAFAPAAFAATVSRAEATAATIGIAGNTQGTDTVKAVNRGNGTTKTGGTDPALGDTLLPRLGVNAGVLFQDATAANNGTSAACSGLAGDGASVVEVGDGDCLSEDGAALNFDLGDLFIGNLVVAGDLSPLAELNALTAALQPVTAPIQEGVVDALPEELGLQLRAGAIHSVCTADPDSADGNGVVTGPLQLVVSIPGVGENHLVNIPVGTGPNQKVLTGLDGVTQAVIDGIHTEIETLVDEQLNPLASQLAPLLQPLDMTLQQVQDQIVETLVGQIREQLLAPLEQNVLDGTINKQDRGDKSIEVTALDVQVLPAVAEQLGASLVSLEIGNVKCGPNGRVAPPAADDGDDGDDEALPDVPTAVTSGSDAISGNAGGNDDLAGLALGATGALLLMAGAGSLMRRRSADLG